MKNIVFDGQMKKDAQKLFENISNENPGGVDIFMKKFQSGNDAAWHRFIKGAYNHPITWWIGLLQLQMQMGVWGPQRKMQSQIASNRLGQILNLIKDNGDGEILYKGVVYNLKYRKADVIGRFVGGVFTNYASTGGRLGGKHIQGGAKRIVSLNNFLLASYGASIKGVASGFFTA